MVRKLLHIIFKRQIYVNVQHTTLKEHFTQKFPCLLTKIHTQLQACTFAV